MNEEEEVPTTNTGREALTVKLKKGKISGHVLMTQQGTLLTRRNKTLSLTKNQKNFLEKIVATESSNSIPLLYTEAMLFPSYFWKTSIDGTCLGAIPTCFMTNDIQTARYEMASVKEHMRNRLTNS